MKTIAFLFLIISFHFSHCQSRLTNNPTEAQFHTEDITRFWKVFDKTYPKFKAKLLQKEYLDLGSPGLKGFIKMRIESSNNLSKTIRKNLSYYQSIKESSLSIENTKQRLYEYFINLKKIYQAAVYPDVYFVIGAKNTGGTTFSGGLIIGAEMFGKETESFKPRISIENLDLIVIHELVHYQQNYTASNTLLAQSIKEGAADFICELITGNHPNKNIYEFGNSHENELWKEFSQQMSSTNWNPWLYGSSDKSRPKDLGYWMGYKITKSFYDKHSNKEEAINAILNIHNFPQFLEESGYKGSSSIVP